MKRSPPLSGAAALFLTMVLIACSEMTGPRPSDLVASLTAGGFHTCVLDGDGAAFCWGLNNHGQLGDGDSTTSAVPVAVAGGLSFVSLAGGTLHTCGLAVDGAAYCWGRNVEGQLGTGSNEHRHVPTPVASTASFVTLTAGAGHTCGVTSVGESLCWGDNRFGQLGDGSKISSTMPVLVAVDDRLVWITAGLGHTCALNAEGDPFCWGRNGYGQLGRGWRGNRSVDTLDFRPGAVERGRRFLGRVRFRTIDAGSDHTCGVTVDDTALCWGNDPYGALGWDFGGELASRPWGHPVRVVGDLRFENIAAGGQHTCGVDGSGRAHCWGYNISGQVGNAERTTFVTNKVPHPVSGAVQFDRLSAGRFHTCGVDTSGSVFCWGNAEVGQVGSAGSDVCGIQSQQHPCAQTPQRVEGLILR